MPATPSGPTAIDLLRDLHQHRIAVNGQLLAAAELLPPETLNAEFPLGQGSLWRTLCHMWGAEWVWLAALQGNPAPTAPGDRPEGLSGNQSADRGMTTLVELRARWAELDRRWLDDLDAASLKEIDDPIEKRRGNSLGVPLLTRRRDIHLHVCLHAHYTAAQAVHFLKRAGAPPLPDVMLISKARREYSGPTGPRTTAAG